MNSKTGYSWSNAKTFKVFHHLTSNDTISISRLGETVNLPAFYSVLSVTLPKDANDQVLEDSLNAMKNYIHFAEKNFFGQFHDAPNDQLYLTEQTGLFDPDHGINVEDAWSGVSGLWDGNIGADYIRIGVYDTGINWDHEDYGDGTQEGTKVLGGHDFFNDVPLFDLSVPDINGHGSACAGIIGALRNNSLGVAGIAGGDVGMGSTGSPLFSMSIPLTGVVTISTLISIASPAIVEGAISILEGGYGLHVMNHSWGSTTANSDLLQMAVKTAAENGCVLVSSSGNSNSTESEYPGSFHDEYVLKTGANDASGDRWVNTGFPNSGSNFGGDIDFIAPGTFDIYATTDAFNNSGYTFDQNGTSFAAPHVVGAAALLMSEHNLQNTNHSYPNDLSPEDVEFILQKYATDVNEEGEDDETGFGRINIAASLSKVSLPKYYVRHALGNNPTSTSTEVIETDIPLTVAQEINGLSPGNYTGNIVKVTLTFTETLNPSETLVDFWWRWNSSKGYGPYDVVRDRNLFVFTEFDVNGNNISITTETWVTEILEDFGGNPVNVYLPENPSNVRTAYSLHIETDFVISSESLLQNEVFQIFPNPVKDFTTLKLSDIDLPSKMEMQIIDGYGKLIRQEMIFSSAQNTVLKEVDLRGFPAGIYIVRLIGGSKVYKKKLCRL